MRSKIAILAAGVLSAGALALPVAVGAAPQASAACTAAPTYTRTKTLFGVHLSTSSQSLSTAFSRTQNTFGKVPIVRIFDSKIPPSTAWKNRTAVIGKTPVVTSFRMPPSEVLAGKYDSQLLQFFSTAPTSQPVFWSYYHEPEKEIDVRKTFTAEAFRNAWKRIAGIAAQTCKSNLYPTLIIMGWSTEPASGRDWRDYYAGSAYTSVVAFDPYNNANGRPSSYPEPSKDFATVVQAAKEIGKPWGIAETGSGLVAGDSGSGRAAWLTKTGNYFRSNGASFVTYFNSSISTVDFRLTDQPSINAWKAFMNS